MQNLNPILQQALVMLMAVVLVAPGLAALYLGFHKDLAEKRTQLQVETMAAEIQRLQGQVDDQQREISRLRVQVGTLLAQQKGLMDVAKRLHQQLVDKGETPLVDIDKLSGLLS